MEDRSVKPIHRSALRARAGMIYYELKRRWLWVKMNKMFAHDFSEPLPVVLFRHKTPFLRQLKDVEKQYQYNKIINLKLAVKTMNGIVLHLGEVFSYWKLIGKPTKYKGYVDGMILNHVGKLLDEAFLLSNHAYMMYSPFIEDKKKAD